MFTFQIQLKDADDIKSDTNESGIKINSLQKLQHEDVIKEENGSSSSMIPLKIPRKLIPWPYKVKNIVRNRSQLESESQEIAIGNQQSLSSSYDCSSLIISDSKSEEQQETTNVNHVKSVDGFVPAKMCDLQSEENRLLMKQGCVEHENKKLHMAYEPFQPQPVAFGSPSELQMDLVVATNKREGQKVVQHNIEDLRVDKSEIPRCIIPSGSQANNKNANSDIVGCSDIKNYVLYEKLNHMMNNLKQHLEQLELNIQSVNANLRTICKILSTYTAKIRSHTDQKPEINISIFAMLNAFEKLYQELQLENCFADHKNIENVNQRASLLKSIKSVIKDLRSVKNQQNSGYLSKAHCSSAEAIDIIHKDNIGRLCNELNANDVKDISYVQNSNVLKSENYSVKKQCNIQKPSQLEESFEKLEVDIMKPKPSTSKNSTEIFERKGDDQIAIVRKDEYNEEIIKNSKIPEHFQTSDLTLCQTNLVKSDPAICMDLPLTSKHDFSLNDSMFSANGLPSEKRVYKFELLKELLKNSDERNSIETEFSGQEKTQCSKDSSITYTFMSSDSPRICDCCSRSYDPVYDNDIMRVISDATKDFDGSDIQIRLNISMNDVIYVKIILMTSLQELKCFYVTTRALEEAEKDGFFDHFNVYLV